MTGLTIRGQYALFWGQWPSNWEHSPFMIAGVKYNCVEQHMMAEKARLFDDERSLKEILASSDPSVQKRLGRGVTGFSESKWEPVRYNVVLTGTLEKYRQNDHLQSLLLETGDLQFVEASPYDTIWGIGMRAQHPDAGDPAKWHGQNLLGKAITEARGIIRRELGLG